MNRDIKMKEPGTHGKEMVMTPFGEQEVDVIYTQNKDTMVLKGKEHGNIFMTSGGFFRSDWYELVGEYDSSKEARVVIDAYYQRNPLELLRALYNSMSPNKV